MKVNLSFSILALTLLVSSALQSSVVQEGLVEGSTGQRGGIAPPFFQSHDPIRIDGDAEFADTAALEEWQGEGTETLPYVVDGLEINASGSGNGIYIGNTTVHFIIRNSKIFGSNFQSSPFSAGAGISLYEARNGSIVGCNCSGNGNYGVYVRGSDDITIRGVHAKDNDRAGIRVMYCTGAYVTECDAAGRREGISITSSGGSGVAGNHLTSSSRGIFIEGSSDLLLEDNNCSICTNGMVIYSCHGAVIRNNSVSLNDEDGIYIYSSNGLTVEGNSVRNNTGRGFAASTSGSAFYDNTFRENGRSGISLHYSSTSTITNNTCIGNGEGGILLSSCRMITVEDNTCHSNYNGIKLERGAYLTSQFNMIRCNLASCNDLAGISIQDDEGGVVRDNRLDHNFFGLELQECVDTVVSENAFERNTRGIQIGGSLDTVVIDNDLIRNGFGIYMGASERGRISDNLFLRNSDRAIRIVASSRSYVIQNNSFVHNYGSGYVYDETRSQCYDGGLYNSWNSTEGWGNYWRDWCRPDEDSDGFVDVPCPISGQEAYDHYPLSESPIPIISTPPNNLSGCGGNGYSMLTWEPPDSDGGSPITGYVVFRGVEGIPPAELDRIDDERTSYNDTDVQNGQTYEYYVIAENALGRSHSSGVIFVVPDGTPPHLEIIWPFESRLINRTGFTLEWQGSDSISGLRGYMLSLDGSGWLNVGLETSYRLSGLSQGGHIISIRALDMAWNANDSAIGFTVDSMAPHLHIRNPGPGDYTNSSDQEVEWTAQDDTTEVSGYGVSMDGVPWIDVGRNTSHMFKDLVDGAHHIEVRSTDKAGNRNVSMSDFHIDTVNPQIEIRSPRGLELHNTNSLLTFWNAYDLASGVASVELRIDGGLWIDTGPVSEYLLEDMEDGYHVLDIRCKDLAGNTAVGSVRFIVDTTPPSVSSHSPVGDDIPKDEIVTIAFSEEMDHETVKISVNAAGIAVVWDSSKELHLTQFRMDPGSSYEIVVTGSDIAGNEMDPFTWHFTVHDGTPDGMGYVTGRIIDRHLEPVSGARILLDGDLETMTDTEGRFNLSVPEGRHFIEVSAGGYTNRTIKIEVSRGAVTDLGDILLAAGSEDRPDSGDTLRTVAIMGAVSFTVLTTGVIVLWSLTRRKIRSDRLASEE